MGQRHSSKSEPIVFVNGSGYLPGVKAAVTINSSSKDLFRMPDIKHVKLGESDKFKGTRGVVYWGENNDLPQQIVSKMEKVPVMSSNILFNISVGYGQGIYPVRYDAKDLWHENPLPVWDNEEINTFFEENDTNGYLLEQLTDLKYFYNPFPCIRLNREAKPKIVNIESLDAPFSRWLSAPGSLRCSSGSRIARIGSCSGSRWLACLGRSRAACGMHCAGSRRRSIRPSFCT